VRNEGAAFVFNADRESLEMATRQALPMDLSRGAISAGLVTIFQSSASGCLQVARIGLIEVGERCPDIRTGASAIRVAAPSTPPSSKNCGESLRS